jgi:membrane protein DedA with SNARE-associated domain
LVLLLSAISAAWFGARTYGSFLLLRSAYGIGMPHFSHVRGWMTLHYLSTTYDVPEFLLVTRLGLPLDTPPDASLISLAKLKGLNPFQYVESAQQALAEIVGLAPPLEAPKSTGWLDWFGDTALASVLKYGPSALALILVLGAIGLPVPSGMTLAVAGSLAGAGRTSWFAVGVIAIAASMLGDTIAYGLGRAAGEWLPQRQGSWIGYSAKRRARAQLLFQRWGAASIVITRTLVSHLSSIVSVLAGMNRYRFTWFLIFVFLGRMIWTLAYMGLGYAIGGSLGSATEFLSNLTGLLLSLALLVGCGLIAWGRESQMDPRPRALSGVGP